MPVDYRDMVTRWQGHPKYVSNKIIESDFINVVVQKLEMILFTNKGEDYGDPNMGCDLEHYLWDTNVPATMIENNIRTQISKYVPELNSMGYSLTIDILQGPEKDQMYLNFIIAGYNIGFSV